MEPRIIRQITYTVQKSKLDEIVTRYLAELGILQNCDKYETNNTVLINTMLINKGRADALLQKLLNPDTQLIGTRLIMKALFLSGLTKEKRAVFYQAYTKRFVQHLIRLVEQYVIYANLDEFVASYHEISNYIRYLNCPGISDKVPDYTDSACVKKLSDLLV